jgi:anti-sigma regulatory factor (Ser/Thr protein kinase)
VAVLRLVVKGRALVVIADSRFRRSEPAYRHEAMLYHGDDDFFARTTDFIREGIAAGEAVLTVVDGQKIDRLRAVLDGDADRVCFADMTEVGHNPALIIQAWRDFVSEQGTTRTRLRGIGEPVSSARSPAALVECNAHESLLNLAFDGTTPFWLLCPYDTSVLPVDVIEHALANHPYVFDHDEHRASNTFRIDDAAGFEQSLPPPPDSVDTFAFDVTELHDLREFVFAHARAFGLDPDHAAELVLAASEIATNSVAYGGRHGAISVWGDGDCFLCEIHDHGHITDPLIGRLRPTEHEQGGYGIWLAHQMCDLVQIRSTTDGTTVRLHACTTRRS